jgi:hypothetical protein
LARIEAARRGTTRFILGAPDHDQPSTRRWSVVAGDAGVRRLIEICIADANVLCRQTGCGKDPIA